MINDLNEAVDTFSILAKEDDGGRSHRAQAIELRGVDAYLINMGSLCVHREGDDVDSELVHRVRAFKSLVISETTPKKGGVERVQAAAAELVTFLEKHMPPRD